MEGKDLLTLDEVAEILHVHVRTIQRRIKEGVLPAYRMPGGQRLYVKRSDLLTSLEPVEPPTGEGADDESE